MELYNLAHTPNSTLYIVTPLRCTLWVCVCSLFYCSLQDGCNAFDACVVGGHLTVVEYLAPKMEGHLFDADDDGYTALHCAAQEGQLPMVEYLVRSCGFDVKARDKVGTCLCG